MLLFIAHASIFQATRLYKILLVYRLSCGTTWHAAGLLGKSRGSRAHTKITIYSNELYSRLEEETGLGTGERGGEEGGRDSYKERERGGGESNDFISNLFIIMLYDNNTHNFKRTIILLSQE